MFFRNNRIYKIDKNGNKKRIFFVLGLKITFKGKNSTVTIHEPFAKFRNCSIICGDNCEISIKNSKYKIRQLKILAKTNNAKCNIGEDFSLHNICLISLSESNTKLTIGDDCMFGQRILLRTTDAHIILDKNNQIINNGKDINIGNHVWVTNDTKILKGVNIADNCVIGTGSLVAKTCDKPNSIYAGIPAKIVKSEIHWLRDTIDNYEYNYKNSK